ncbi:MAG TPA: type VI secretion system tube protein Hcp [Roseiarcus sp.]|jgi:type VI secretion system secreted protein Hcp|nr:type VI secretion system tube protein Hcp [Roseiarcus sp.]
MAVDMILELENVTGESKVQGFLNHIDISSFSWGASNSGSAHMGGGASGGGKGNIHDMSFTKTVDNSSPILFKLCYQGKHIPTGKLHVRKAAGDEKLEYQLFVMTEVYITNVSMGDAAGNETPSESFTLTFAKIKYTYKQQSETGGDQATPEFEVDVKSGQVT